MQSFNVQKSYAPKTHHQILENPPRLIAILGGSGSGKTMLGLELANKLDCEIFSLDSLAIYRDFDIVSAKPSALDCKRVFHYGINILHPNEQNNAMLFRNLLLDAITQTNLKKKRTLLIIGGSSFYLKSIIEGLSPSPILSPLQKQSILEQINSLPDPYAFLSSIDPQYPLHPNDTYRLHQALMIYFSTQMPPSLFFATHPKEAFPYDIEKYLIHIDRPALKEKIHQRTKTMLKQGLLEEIEGIFGHYPYSIQPASAIGVRESIEFLTQTPLEILQNKSPKTKQIAKSQEELASLISTHTAQLAKRQNTFNQYQFGEVYELKSSLPHTIKGIIKAPAKELLKFIP